VDGRLLGAATEDWNTKVAARVQQLRATRCGAFSASSKSAARPVLAQQKARVQLSELDLQARDSAAHVDLSRPAQARQTLIEIMKGGGDLDGKIGRLETQLAHEKDENLSRA